MKTIITLLLILIANVSISQRWTTPTFITSATENNATIEVKEYFDVFSCDKITPTFVLIIKEDRGLILEPKLYKNNEYFISYKNMIWFFIYE